MSLKRNLILVPTYVVRQLYVYPTASLCITTYYSKQSTYTLVQV